MSNAAAIAFQRMARGDLAVNEAQLREWVVHAADHIAALETERDTLAEQLRTAHGQVAEVARLLDPEVCPDAWGLHAAAQKVLAQRDEALRLHAAGVEAAERMSKEFNRRMVGSPSDGVFIRTRGLLSELDILHARKGTLEEELGGVRSQVAGWRVRCKTAEARLAAIHRRAENGQGLLDAFLDGINESLEHTTSDGLGAVARFLLGEVAEATVQGAHKPGTNSGCTCIPGHRRVDCPALLSAPPFPCCGGSDEHPPQHTRDCGKAPGEIDCDVDGKGRAVLPGVRAVVAPRPVRPAREREEPSTAEAFAAVNGLVDELSEGREDGPGWRVLRKRLALLERRMGAMVRAMRAIQDDVRACPCTSYSADAVCGRCERLAQLVDEALTDAPAVFTMEEVEREHRKCAAGAVTQEEIQELRERLAQLHKKAHPKEKP